MNLNELRDEAYSIAKANGWHEEEHSDSHWLMLIITEIAEAVQADRKDRHTDIGLFKALLETYANDDAVFKYEFETHVKNGVEDELADIIIRCLDYSALCGICLDNVPIFITDYCRDKSIVKRDFPTFAYFLTFKAVNGDVTDVLARVIAYCKLKGIDLDFFIRAKMKYNRLRGYKHGGKRY